MADDWNAPKDSNLPPKPNQQQQPPQQWEGHQPDYYDEPESHGSGIPGWVFWVGGLLLFNGLSYAFGWGFIIY